MAIEALTAQRTHDDLIGRLHELHRTLCDSTDGMESGDAEAVRLAIAALTATGSPVQGEVRSDTRAALVEEMKLCLLRGEHERGGLLLVWNVERMHDIFDRAVALSSPSPEGQDVTCQHGVAMDVHCCNCHSGFLFDPESCVCGKPYESLTMDLWAAICDLPDRTSPEDDPDAAVVTLEELRLVVANVMEERADVRPHGLRTGQARGASDRPLSPSGKSDGDCARAQARLRAGHGRQRRRPNL
jgi:hypothetical protein